MALGRGDKVGYINVGEADMLKRLGSHSDSMILALVLWLCSLPLVLLIVVPLLGLTAAGIATLTLLFVAMVLCWGVCSWKVFQNQAH